MADWGGGCVGSDKGPQTPLPSTSLEPLAGKGFEASGGQQAESDEEWTAGELNPDLQRAMLASSRWTSSPFDSGRQGSRTLLSLRRTTFPGWPGQPISGYLP